MIIKPQMHTVFFLAGPSGSGKSTLAKQMQRQLCDALHIPGPNNHFHPIVKILSSDQTRTEILADLPEDLDMLSEPRFQRLGTEYMQASQQAFALMQAKLKAYTTYPCNAQFVILDATNFSNESRKDFLEIAKANHYATEMIVLDYKDRSEFLKYLPESHSRKLVFDHIERLHTKFYPDLNPKDYVKIHKIRTKDFSNIEFDIQNLDLFKKCQINNDIVHVIPDLHGCMKEFKQALQNLGYILDGSKVKVPEHIKDHKVVLLGDLIDKGPDSKEIIHFLHDNTDFFKICIGNHENFIYKKLKGLIKNEVPQELLDKYFTTLKEFEGDEETIAKFNDLVENHMVPFVRNRYMIANHAPCSIKYLGKVDSESRKRQRNFRIPRKETEEDKRPLVEVWEAGLKFWKDEAQYNQPYNFSGHVPLSKIARVKNRFLIDGGLAHNNGLFVVTVNPFTKGRSAVKSFFVKREVPIPNQDENLFTIFNKNYRSSITVENLEGRELTRLKWLAHNKVNFISGTMAPANKDEGSNELESIDQALNYYRNAGVEKVVLQQKYMGSRCQIYLDQDLDKCMATSRKGYQIRHYDDKTGRGVDMLPIYKKLHEQQLESMKKNNIQTLIIDGELMPWSALGAGLIDKQFKTIGYAIESENALLKQTGFENHIKKLIDAYQSSEFKDDWDRMKKKDMIAKYGHGVYSNFRTIRDYHHQDQSELEPFIDTYKRQIELYGQKGEISYKPFDLLKTIYVHGTEATTQNILAFNAYRYTYVNPDDPCISIDLSGPKANEKAHNFFVETTLEKLMEGVVVKPELVTTPNVAPFLKVRNHNYLTIVYGYDFKTKFKYDRLMKQKSIRSKLRTSIQEFEIGMNMLKIPRASIDRDNTEYANLVAQMIAQEKKEVHLDPRL